MCGMLWKFPFHSSFIYYLLPLVPCTCMFLQIGPSGPRGFTWTAISAVATALVAQCVARADSLALRES